MKKKNPYTYFYRIPRLDSEYVRVRNEGLRILRY